MTRRILLTLPDAVDREHCGECPFRSPTASGMYCRIFDRFSPVAYTDNVRHSRCLASEDEANKIVSVKDLPVAEEPDGDDPDYL